MDVVSALAGAMTAVIALGAALISLHRRFRNWLKDVVTDVLTETGVIRYTHPADDVRDTWQSWPGDHKNLPDAIEGIYVRIGHLEDSQGTGG